ncbi:head-tail connector protein [Pyramidobacter piscolens]|uniref:head-tail connector protein n=1 Tax=Pyramidobacter piscolens TaxID=638849 RepID=UPI003AB7EADD
MSGEAAVEPISLAEAKAHLRVVADDEDALISVYIAASRQYAERYQNRIYVATTGADGEPLTPEKMTMLEKAACLLLIGHLYENRVAVNVGGAVTEVPFGTKALLSLRRKVPV